MSGVGQRSMGADPEIFFTVGDRSHRVGVCAIYNAVQAEFIKSEVIKDDDLSS